MQLDQFGINPRETGFAPLDFLEIFGNSNPVVLEIGSGKGRFLVSSATERPDANFLGIEKSLHYYRLIRDRLAKRNLVNARIMNHDAFLIMQKMIPESSIAEVHIYFPDPWPRPREQKRRIIRPEVLTEIGRILVPGGSGINVTDHREYFEAAAPLIAGFFESEARVPGPDEPPRTNYEAKYRAAGRPIYEVRFVKSN